MGGSRGDGDAGGDEDDGDGTGGGGECEGEGGGVEWVEECHEGLGVVAAEKALVVLSDEDEGVGGGVGVGGEEVVGVVSGDVGGG